jgi:hypothetical protein
MSGAEEPRSRKSGGPAACPVCSKPAAPAFRPFCSDRCRKVDLNRWLSEVYRIPAPERDQNGENQSESED